jgi:hypothetical protein
MGGTASLHLAILRVDVAPPASDGAGVSADPPPTGVGQNDPGAGGRLFPPLPCLRMTTSVERGPVLSLLRGGPSGSPMLPSGHMGQCLTTGLGEGGKPRLRCLLAGIAIPGHTQAGAVVTCLESSSALARHWGIDSQRTLARHVKDRHLRAGGSVRIVCAPQGLVRPMDFLGTIEHRLSSRRGRRERECHITNTIDDHREPRRGDCCGEPRLRRPFPRSQSPQVFMAMAHSPQPIPSCSLHPGWGRFPVLWIYRNGEQPSRTWKLP